MEEETGKRRKTEQRERDRVRQKQRDEEEEEETGRDRQREREGGGRSAEVWVKRLSESDRGERKRSGKTLPLAKVRALSLIYRCSLPVTPHTLTSGAQPRCCGSGL